jgi:hypothetical protein
MGHALISAERGVSSGARENGFDLVAVKPIPSEPADDPMAVYRQAAPPV